ncbi:MAG: type II toxin-antitoxin system VapC family toxin [Vicinamibacteria bacterium]
MALTIADSDVLIDALRGRKPAMARVANELEKAALGTTTITVFELLSGAKTAASRRKIQKLLAAMRIFGLDQRAAEAAAAVRQELEAKGISIGMGDYLIAGICLVHSATLLTRNSSYFERVPRLQVRRGD